MFFLDFGLGVGGAFPFSLFIFINKLIYVNLELYSKDQQIVIEAIPLRFYLG